jgi:hypothetical protein
MDPTMQTLCKQAFLPSQFWSGKGIMEKMIFGKKRSKINNLLS